MNAGQPLEARVSDCTLRDTRNAPGVFMTVEHVVEIARRLDALGVDEIEIAGGGYSEDERRLARAVNDLGLRAPTSCLVFCINSEDIHAAIDFVEDVGSRTMMISLPTSERFIQMRLKRSLRAACKLVEKVVGEAVKRGISVVFSGEDAARADPVHLVDFVRAGAGAGASRFRFAESVSALDPLRIGERFALLRESTDVALDVHCHSSFGLGVANTLAALRAGATWASCTVGGLGERGGNTPLESIVLYLARLAGRRGFALEHLKPLAEAVGRATDIAIPRFASAVGDDAFLYEKGNMFLHHEAYEAYPPEAVGAKRRLAVGKKGDALTVRTMLTLLGLDPASYDTGALAQRMQELAWERRRCLDGDDLAALLNGGGEEWKAK